MENKRLRVAMADSGCRFFFEKGTVRRLAKHFREAILFVAIRPGRCDAEASL